MHKKIAGEPMEELTQYIKADFAVLVAVLYCIGRGLKAIQRFPNQFIPPIRRKAARAVRFPCQRG